MSVAAEAVVMTYTWMLVVVVATRMLEKYSKGFRECPHHEAPCFSADKKPVLRRA